MGKRPLHGHGSWTAGNDWSAGFGRVPGLFSEVPCCHPAHEDRASRPFGLCAISLAATGSGYFPSFLDCVLSLLLLLTKPCGCLYEMFVSR